MGLNLGEYTREVSYVGDASNDRISSFKCDNICRIPLYTDRSFEGHHALNYNQASKINTASCPKNCIS